MISANEATKMTRKTRDDFWESDEGSKFIAMAAEAVKSAASVGENRAVIQGIPFGRSTWKMREFVGALDDAGFEVDCYRDHDNVAHVTLCWSSS
mgnify:CR=1 FL=1